MRILMLLFFTALNMAVVGHAYRMRDVSWYFAVWLLDAAVLGAALYLAGAVLLARLFRFMKDDDEDH